MVVLSLSCVDVLYFGKLAKSSFEPAAAEINLWVYRLPAVFLPLDLKRN